MKKQNKKNKTVYLKAEDIDDIHYHFIKERIPHGLIDFMFECWSIQGFKDASGKRIPKQKAIESIIENKDSKTWMSPLIREVNRKFRDAKGY